MRKLNEVKEQNNSSEEEEDEENQQIRATVNGFDMVDDHQNRFYTSNHENCVELRSINDYSRLFINEEEEEYEQEIDRNNVRGESTKPISLVSP